MTVDKYLLGKTILKLELADDNKALRFTCTDGEHIARTDGDCCSDSWVEGIELPALGFPCLVLDMIELDMPEAPETDYGCIATYGLKIVTDRGDMVIDYRNSSNGYYGGNLSWPGEYFYGGVYGQNVSSEQWVEVKHEQEP